MKALKLFLACVFIGLTMFTTGHASDSKTGALLWKISSKGLEKPSYILGTFHLAPKEKLDSIPGATKALDACEQVVGEIIMADALSQPQKMQEAGMMPADTTYQMLYTEKEYQRVNENIKNFLGVDLGQLGALKPSLIQVTIAMQMFLEYIPEINPAESIDNYVQQYATETGKKILGLESVEEQYHVLFKTTSLKRQAELLLCMLEETEHGHDLIITLIEAYNQADLTTMQNLMVDKESQCPPTQAEIDVLLKNRNDKWIEKLPAIMSERSSFIAVGAGHLTGETGLLTQLEKLGYLVEPVF